MQLFVALNNLECAGVPLKNYSLTHSCGIMPLSKVRW